MNNKYLVIKLPGNWIDREQIKQRIKIMLGVEVLDERSVVTYSGTQYMSAACKHDNKECEDYIKRSIASSIGRRIAATGLMRFSESQKDICNIGITGEVTVIEEVDDD